jgi:hypothetical protein
VLIDRELNKFVQDPEAVAIIDAVERAVIVFGVAVKA